MKTEEIIKKFRAHGLRVTPQRIAVFKAVRSLSHPDANTIFKKLEQEYPNITVATVYNNLKVLVKARLIRIILSEEGKMKYDGILEEHHHLLDTNDGSITDYFDEGLTNMLQNYFRQKPVPGFRVSRIMVQLIGSKDKNNQNKKLS